MDLDASLHWLGLSVTPGLAARLTSRLLKTLGPPEAIFSASLTELEACRLPAPVAQAIHSRDPLKAAEKELAELRKLDGKLVHWEEPLYPKLLLEIFDPPPLLYVRGDPAVLRRHCLSMVGTRRPTPYGNLMAERLAHDLAERGLVIVSGLARGIDSSAHKGAVAAKNGATIGVLGTGLDVVYPKESKKLYAQIIERGALITEFQLGCYPAPENFPIRNRIVAGMSLGAIIVEGAQYSGSLITARLAMEFGREVFGVPGHATQPASFAPHQLIKQGAKLVANWLDVVEELPTAIRAELFPVETPSLEERTSLFEASLNDAERKLFALLSAEEPLHIDALVEQSSLNSSVVLPTLFELEMKGFVRQMPGKQFLKVLF